MTNRDWIPDEQIMTRKEIYDIELKRHPNSPKVELNAVYNNYLEWLDGETGPGTESI